MRKKQLKYEGLASADALDELNRRYVSRYDKLLDACFHGLTHLKIDSIAQLLIDSLHYWDNSQIELITYVIISNHVHAVFTLSDQPTETGAVNSLKHLMQSIKSFSGRQANQLLDLTGKFWEEESYDQLVRNNGELVRIIRYVLNNPVKAGLCHYWREWPWTYIKPEYDMF